MTKIAPVYPKQDPEYRKRTMDQFYKQVRETNWGDMSGEYQGKPRGRKAKITERPIAKPRPSEKYNWFNK
jgi:hypothetical protein